MLDDGVIARANTTFLEWTGHAAVDVIGVKRFQDLLPVAGKIYYDTHVRPLLAMQGHVHEVAFDLVRKDGTLFPALVNSSRRGGADEAAVVVSTVFNATDRRRYEQELLRAKRQAEADHQAKLALLSMIGHDVRSPLSVFVNVVGMLGKTPLNEQQQRLVALLKSSTSSLSRLVDDVMSYSALESGAWGLQNVAFGLRPLLEQLAESQGTQARAKGLEFILRVDPPLPERVMGDPVKLEQLLDNLLRNAVKFTSRGSVSLSAEAEAAEHGVCTVKFAVSDTGIGIRQEALPKIFEDFVQADEQILQRYGGSGLGLAISRRILELYGSRMDVQSVVGEGSTFSFSLRLRLAA
jgi:PAS domain S-box-containing protein